MKLDPLAYCTPEMNLFPALAKEFAETGKLDPVGLYVVLDWKAARAKTKHLSRLIKRAQMRGVGNDFRAAARQIGRDLTKADGPERRLQCLIVDWGFRLPTATAILSVLYPDTFTIYDVRVCTQLNSFHNLANRKWSSQYWTEYLQFVRKVQARAHAERPGLSLRECDRWLWGKDRRKAVRKAIKNAV